MRFAVARHIILKKIKQKKKKKEMGKKMREISRGICDFRHGMNY